MLVWSAVYFDEVTGSTQTTPTYLAFKFFFSVESTGNYLISLFPVEVKYTLVHIELWVLRYMRCIIIIDSRNYGAGMKNHKL